MTVRELREKYLAFFESKGHSRFPSAPLIPYDVTGRLDESLLFNGAGMIQFKPYFRGIAKPKNVNLTTCQKCVRTGDIDVVGDATHLTFFEMLGNFSFGDYFKAQAIAYSWEFLTSPDWLGLDKNRLAFTVFEEDDESYGEWERWLRASDLDPSTRIFRLGEDTNYWPAGSFSAGPPGPCGPNSEMFFWLSNDEPAPSGHYTKEDFVRDEAAGKWLEIWNDVFIQYDWEGHLKNPDRPSEGWVKDGMPPLPFKSVDTGMGMERSVATMNGQKSCYQTDAFLPIFRILGEISSQMPIHARHSEPQGVGVGGSEEARNSEPGAWNSESGELQEQGHTSRSHERVHGLPEEQGQTSAGLGIPIHVLMQAMAQGLVPNDETTVHAARIIADHIRTAVFCIADGVLPSNTGRGYVLRRLIRRAVLKGQRVLGFEDLFLYRVYDGVVESMGHHYGELLERREVIVETLRNEETLFRRTLVQGVIHFSLTLNKPQRVKRANESLGSVVSEEESNVYPGEDAFFLYDTYGFPLEVTQELAEEAGKTVDVEGYERAMKEAQERSRAVGGSDTVYGGVTITFEFEGEPTPTEFTGYLETETDATIVAALRAPVQEQDAPDTHGQDGHATLVVALDRTPFYSQSGGQISDTGVMKGDGFELKVIDVTKEQGVYVHLVETQTPMEPEELFGKRVKAIVDVKRRGSIRRNHTATHLMHAALRNVLGKHVTHAGSYVGPDRLRFDFTHGKAMTPQEVAEVEHIVNERVLDNRPVKTYVDIPVAEAKAMGAMALFGEKYGNLVRVVQVGDEPEAVPAFSRELCGGTHVRSTGEIGLFKILSEASAASGIRRIEAVTGEGAYEWVLDLSKQVRDAAHALKANPHDLVSAVERTQEQVRELNKRLERLRSQAATGSAAQVKQVGSVELAVEKLSEGETKDATLVADRLAQNAPNRVVVVGLSSGGNASIVVKVGVNAQTRGANGNRLVKELAQIAEGRGGGRPDFATAGGLKPEMVDEALAAAEGLLQAMLKS